MGRAPWWLALPTALIVLTVADLVARSWQPGGERLSTGFSPLALIQRIDRARSEQNPIVALGDSVVWGYGVAPSESAVSQLSRVLRRPVVNLSFEGGSPANTYFVLRLLLARGVRPGVVVFNVNDKTFNPDDSAYRRLHPSLERDVAAMLGRSDRQLLALQPPGDFSAHIGAAVERIWRLYAIRADARAALFGAEDAATALASATGDWTGRNARERRAHVATADRFLGTYDLAPIGAENVALRYLRATRDLLASQHIRYVAFLTPTNHRLLADLIDVKEYRANLALLAHAISEPYGSVLDLDRAVPASDFLDNDHLTVAGNRMLAQRLAPLVATGS